MLPEQILNTLKSMNLKEEDFNEGVQRRYSEYMEEGDVSKLETLMNFTDIQPTDEVVQKGYQTILLKFAPAQYTRLNKLTDVEPDIPENVVQDAFRLCINMITKRYKNAGKNLEAEEISAVEQSILLGVWQESLQEELGFSPSEDVIQEGYRAFILNGQLKSFELLQEITGIEPPDDEVSSFAYRTYFHKGQLSNAFKLLPKTDPDGNISEKVLQKFYVDSFEKIKNAKGPTIEECRKLFDQLEEILELANMPSEEVIQKFYVDYLESYDDAYNMLFELTGVKPDIPEETIQRICENWLRDGEFINLEYLEEFFKVKPVLSETLVQETYAKLIKAEVKGAAGFLYDLYELTNVEPNIPEETVQEGYKKCLKQESNLSISDLKKFTGIEPDIPEHLIQEAYSKAVDKGKDYRLHSIYKETGVEPSQDTMDKAYIKSIKAGLNKFQELQKDMGIETSDKVNNFLVSFLSK